MRVLGYSCFLIFAAAAAVLWGCGKTETTCGDLGLTPAGNKYPHCDAPMGGAAGKGGNSSAGGSPGAGGTAGKGGSTGAESGQGGEAGSATNMGGKAGSAGKAGAGGKAGGSAGGMGGSSAIAGTGGESAAGMGGSEPCGGTCKGTTPVCDAGTDTCVECTKNAHCGSEAPVCDKATNTCVECTSTNTSKCQGATPVCDGTSSMCVECTATNFAKCTGSTPICDLNANQCVACLTNTDCSSPAAARCTNDNRCAACMNDGDCAHLSGTHLCSAGTCVQCTPADETACGANSCNPATHQCTTTPRGSVATCEPCLADSECMGNDQSDPVQRCVPMSFQGLARPGGFCLTRAITTCSQPYKTLISVASLSGAPAENYCSIQTITTCEAVRDFVLARTCSDGQDTSCGCTRDNAGNCAMIGKGGLCKTISLDPNQCTYQCGNANDCPAGKTCAGVGTTYCQ